LAHVSSLNYDIQAKPGARLYLDAITHRTLKNYPAMLRGYVAILSSNGLPASQFTRWDAADDVDHSKRHELKKGTTMKKLSALLLAGGIMLISPVAFGQQPEKPTVVLVHGAFADASSWSGVIKILEKDGYNVVAAANPLRSVKSDADSVARVVSGIKSSVILVGHSYGGSVITEAGNHSGNVKALVFVSAFAPDKGETSFGLAGKFPGATLNSALAPPVVLSDGGNDLYIDQAKFPDQFAADVPKADAKVMAVTQRPIQEAAGNEVLGEPAWKTIPSWFIYGDKDKNIPPQAMAWMADRAKSKQTVVVKGGSHVVMVSHPDAVAKLIEAAAGLKSAADTKPAAQHGG
jgi:pimeloyl-ACP methyl ester carboxylesterase